MMLRTSDQSLSIGNHVSLASTPEAYNLLIQALLATGDDLLLRVRTHVVPIGLHLYEQINRDNGGIQGAYDLTWSYGTMISALKVRAGIQRSL